MSDPVVYRFRCSCGRNGIFRLLPADRTCPDCKEASLVIWRADEEAP